MYPSIKVCLLLAGVLAQSSSYPLWRGENDKEYRNTDLDCSSSENYHNYDEDLEELEPETSNLEKKDLLEGNQFEGDLFEVELAINHTVFP